MKRSLAKTFMKYASLNILGMLAISVYILADTYYISKAIGPLGLTALNLSIAIYSFIHGMGLMIGIGGATRFSIAMSEGKTLEGPRIFTMAMKLGLLVSLFFVMLGMFFVEPLAKGLGADAETLVMTKTYLSTILIFSPLFILNNMLIAFVRNDQNPKGAMKAMVMGSLSNILLDYLFMFPLGLGMFGAAIATSAAPLISMMVLYPHFKQRGTKLFLPKVSLAVSSVKDFFSLGMSALVVEVSSGVVLLTFNLLILGLEGNDGVAAYGIVANLALVAIAIFTGLSQGVQPLFSRYHGEGNDVYLEKSKNLGLITALSLGLLLYGVVGFFAGSLVDIFNSQGNAHIATMAERGLRVYFLGLILTGVNILLSTLASATERVKEGFFLSMARGIFVILPLVFVGAKLFGMDGVWMSFGLTELLVLGATSFFFLRRKEDRRKAWRKGNI